MCLGFRPEGTTHELGHEFVFYVLTREAWMERTGSEKPPAADPS